MNQQEKVLRHLYDYGSITPLDALGEYGIMRLGARIWDLRHRGFDIQTKMEYGRNRYDEPTRWARYFIEK